LEKRKVKDRTEATHALPNKPLVDSSVDVAWPRFRYKEVSKPTTQANQSIFSSYHDEDEIVCTKEDQEQCERKKESSVIFDAVDSCTEKVAFLPIFLTYRTNSSNIDADLFST
jgi:hypothetical protein